MIWLFFSVFGSALGDKLPTGSSYLPPTPLPASNGYGAPAGGQASYGGGSDDYSYDDEIPAYSENQVRQNTALTTVMY
jgi:hypothetical protein